jgi:DNA ligase (NAD+)
VTPVAELEPVDLQGSLISRATLNNLDYVRRLGVRKGCSVHLEKAGDVIPRVVRVVADGSAPAPITTENTVEWICPCNERQPLTKREDGELYCEFRKCPEKLVQAVVHFASRDAMNIPGMGEATARTLVTKGLIASLDDIYALKAKREQLLEMDGWGERKVMTLFQNIAESQKRPIATFIYALGLPHIGKNAAKLLARRFENLDALFGARADELQSIDGIGAIVSRALEQHMQDRSTRSYLER